ncbi:Signal transduction histidine kinase [Rubritalea squalenifaciens DSM 18772]|uniref:histidine kinase n=1 Tax=Rubritalea squalenifaciens DSM 18772 TaxID=1123071 RepID=A0A1M6GYI6_9BACT|nr:ATP-binding protein [Rubritalea squalenifaciens]SHJ15028.1 Signal transduction histidine kinase [Rubritalea squalenifaciens DSM 18772]
MKLTLKASIQVWHGLILFLVLLALGLGFYFYEKDHRLTQLDTQIDQFAPMIVGAKLHEERLHERRGPRGRVGREGGPPPAAEEPLDEHGEVDGWVRRESLSGSPVTELDGPQATARGFEIFEEVLVPQGYYYRVANYRNPEDVQESSNFPAVGFPEGLGVGYFVRFREVDVNEFRELYHGTSRFRVLIGRDMEGFYKGLNLLRLQIVGGVVGVFLLGTGVGWLMVSRCLSPLREIERASSEIADGKLGVRISPMAMGRVSELGELAENLNETFGKLEGAFQRQIRFTADASHELRTPLTSLMAQLALGLKRERSVKEYDQILTISQRSGRRIQRITEQLIELTLYDSGAVDLDYEIVELRTLLTALQEELTPYVLEQECTLKVQLGGGDIECDPFRLEQVVTNLINNAIQHNGGGIAILLRCEVREQEAIIEVSDNGKGIQPGNLDRLFDRFFQESSSRSNEDGRQNVGLGLSVSQAIVQAHGGSFEVCSKPSVETVFRVILPVERILGRCRS